jgi:hypothetical protein
MCKHEENNCPRCNKPFECKVGDITNCQCYGISFTPEEKTFIAERYNSCLCAACLNELKNKYVVFKEKFLSNGK